MKDKDDHTKMATKRPYAKPTIEVVRVFEDGKALYGILACGCHTGSGQRASP